MENPRPPESGSDFAALVAELRAEFLGEAQQQCRALAGALQHSFSESDRAQARRVIHRWAGLGGTLGYPEVTRLAREVERLLIASELGSFSAKLAELARLFENPPPAADLE